MRLELGLRLRLTKNGINIGTYFDVDAVVSFENFRALKLTLFESFRVLKFYNPI